MREQVNNSRTRLSLPDEIENQFVSLEQIHQEQIIFDAWRRTLQDWRHMRYNDWKQIPHSQSNGRDIELDGWQAETTTAGVPDADELILDHRGILSELDGENKDEFFKLMVEHITEIVESRY